jgi:hypothetical protein
MRFVDLNLFYMATGKSQFLVWKSQFFLLFNLLVALHWHLCTFPDTNALVSVERSLHEVSTRALAMWAAVSLALGRA